MQLSKEDYNVDNIMKNLVDDVLDVVDSASLIQFKYEDQVVHIVHVVSTARLHEPASKWIFNFIFFKHQKDSTTYTFSYI